MFQIDQTVIAPPERAPKPVSSRPYQTMHNEDSSFIDIQ
jgi:hypothetical protein